MDQSTMTPRIPIMTCVADRYAQTTIAPETIDYKYTYMCKVVFTGNESLIETRYFRTYERSVRFAKTRVYPDPAVRISIHIYGIPYEETANFLDRYYISSLHN